MTFIPNDCAFGTTSCGNAAEAHQAERAAAKPVDRHDVRHLPLAGVHLGVDERDLAHHRQQQRHRVVGHLVDAVVGNLGDDDPRRRGGRDVHVVDADAEAGNDPAPSASVAIMSPVILA